jgi:hypothetical protein
MGFLISISVEDADRKKGFNSKNSLDKRIHESNCEKEVEKSFLENGGD